MAMNVRFTDEETQALREQAEVEHRSMDAVTRAAVREYIDRRRHRADVVNAAAEGAHRYADALKRLGEL
jgi:predicted transcriptional regulator